MKKTKIYLAQINTIVGDLEGNAKKILQEFRKAEAEDADLAIFCEMSVTGYPAEDLWLKKYFIDAANEKIKEILAATKGSRCAMVLGAPHSSLNRANKNIIHNAAFLLENGEVKKIMRKKTLPNYGVFDEKRYFEAESALSFFEFRNQTFAFLICEDIWDLKNLYLLQEQVFDCVISINSSPYSTNKNQYRNHIAQQFTASLKKPFIYLNQVGGQDSLVFDGGSFVLDENGKKVLELKKFAEDSATIDLNKGSVAPDQKLSAKNYEENFVFSNNDATKNFLQKDEQFFTKTIGIANDYNACLLGLRDYIVKNNFSKVILGMSGGIDSALVATLAVDAIGAENVKLYALPSRFNSESSMNDAKECAKNLRVDLEVISIEKAFATMVSTLYDYCGAAATSKAASLARENLQSRIRGNILMTISNTTGALLLSTGNKSELAVGYATIYGDMCGAFNPLKDLYKTHVYELVKWRNSNVSMISLCKSINLIPQSIVIKEPTAELRDNQKDSDSLPPYEILDKILFALIEENKSIAEIIKSGFDSEIVKKVAKLFYSSEYKRHQAVIGPKISNMSFDKDRRYPITNKFWQ